MTALVNTPPVANPTANHMLTTVYGSPAARQTPRSRAAQSGKRARTALTAHSLGLLSDIELGEQEAFDHGCKARAQPGGALGDAAPPAWFGPAMAPIVAQLANITTQQANITAQLANHTAQLANITTEVANHTAQQANHTAQLANITARQLNSVATSHNDALVPLRNAAGVAALTFPATLGAFQDLRAAEVLRLLQFYGCPANPDISRQQRLKQFIGIPG